MSSVPTINAKVTLECQNTLGEGILWDSKEGLLHWVDIDEAKVHTYDPKTKQYGVDSYPETKFITALGLRREHPGFVGLMQHEVALLPAPARPTGTSTKPTPTPRKSEKVLAKPLTNPADELPSIRFNDGGVDTLGNYFAGSMTAPGSALRDGTRRGELWRVEPSGKSTLIKKEIGTSNGIAWTEDGKYMYYVDSAIPEVNRYSINSSGLPEAPVKIADTPSGAAEGTVFDGLCLDGVGNIWVARWKDQRVVGYKPDGTRICDIKTPGSLSPTIPCFGGPNLETMYIATAHSKLGGKDQQDKLPHSGDLFEVDFSEGSEVRKLLGEGWKGAERYRFAG